MIGLALAGLGVAAMTSVIAKSRILTAQEQMRGLESGILAFLKDQENFAKTFANEHVSLIDSKMTETLTKGHLGAGKHYWDLGKSSSKLSDFAPTDPFGGVYWIVLDADGDGRVKNPAVAENEQWLNSRVLIFSAGPDGDPTTWKDNVRNWK